MKKILLTTAAILLLQGAITAQAEFTNQALKGTYGYSLTGFGTIEEGDPTEFFPVFISEAGAFLADGEGNITPWTGATSGVGTSSTGPFTFSDSLIEYTGCTYNVEFNGRGTITCTRGGVQVDFYFAIDDHNKEVRLGTNPFNLNEIDAVVLNGTARQQFPHF